MGTSSSSVSPSRGEGFIYPTNLLLPRRGPPECLRRFSLGVMHRKAGDGL